MGELIAERPGISARESALVRGVSPLTADDVHERLWAGGYPGHRCAARRTGRLSRARPRNAFGGVPAGRGTDQAPSTVTVDLTANQTSW